jgi:hypothetical protein
MHTRLEGNIDDDIPDMQNALENLSSIHDEVSDRKWEIRCGTAKYLGPWIASVLYAAWLRGKQLGQEPKIKLPKEPHCSAALVRYCHFAGMTQHFARGPAPDSEHPKCETIPLSRFDRASWSLSDGIVRLLNRHMTLSNDGEDQLRMCIQEVTQNVVDHAESSIGGVMSAR